MAVRKVIYYIFAAKNKIGEIFRFFCCKYSCKGIIKNNGRLMLKKNVAIDVREGGEMYTGKGIVSIRQGSSIIVESGGCLVLGDDVAMNINCYIAVHSEISIGNNTILGPGVVIVDQDHDYKADGGLKDELYKVGKVKIGNNVWIGANSVILRDTVIGDNAVIGAGSIVKGRVAEGEIYIRKK